MRVERFSAVFVVVLLLFSITTTIMTHRYYFAAFDHQKDRVDEGWKKDDTMDDTMDERQEEGINLITTGVVDQIQKEIQEKNNSNNNNNKRAPLVFGAGRGATATHTMTAAMCNMGIPSIHYDVGCIPYNEISIGGTINERVPPNESLISKKYTELSRRCEMVRLQVNTIARCITLDDCPRNTLAEWIRNNTVKRIDELIEYTKIITMEHKDYDGNDGNGNDGDRAASPTIISFNDFPYPSIMPTFIRTVQKYYNGAMPSIVLTEREPEEYVRRRIDLDQAWSDLVCKEKSTMLPQTFEYGAFDVIGCIDNYFANFPEQKSTATIQDVFTSIHKVYHDNVDSLKEDEIIKGLALQVREYQDIVRGRADFSINLFEEKVRLTYDALAEKMISSGANAFALEGRKRCEYVSFWKRARVDEKHFFGLP